MKKLIFVLLLLPLFVLVSCSAKDDMVRNSGDGTKVITTVEEPDKEPLTLNTVKAENTATPDKNTGPELKITSLKEETLKTKVGYHVIRGTTSNNTVKIKVNDYTLTKYRAGQTKWTYIASKGIGTLKAGNNDYKVQALDREGAEIASTDFSIAYEPTAAPDLPKVGPSLTLAFLMSLVLSLGWLGIRKWRKNLN